jgi:DNA modification methylase
MTKSKNSIKPGDIFQLGVHRLACGDCRDGELIARLIGKDRITAMVQDPPYGVEYTESKNTFSKVKKNKIIANDDITSELDYTVFTKDWLNAAVPYMTKKNAIYIFNSDKMLFALRAGMEAAGMKFSQLIIWIKNHSVVGRKDYLPQHELIAYGWAGTHQFMKGKDKSVLFYPKPNKSGLHPTTKPVALLRHLILNSTGIGDVVYDGFGGSGSTLIAAEHTKRKCLMIELDPEYCQTIIDRFQQVTGIKAVKLPASARKEVSVHG